MAVQTPLANTIRKNKAPMIGMKFDCDDSAYEFYKQYAHRMGFSVRKKFVR